MSVIEVDKVSKFFRDREEERRILRNYNPFTRFFKGLFLREYKKVLDEVSFEVKEGEIFGLLGPNGSGKTTMAKIISGLISPSSGYVKLLGETNKDKVKNDFNAVFARAALFWHLRGGDNLEFYSDVYRIKGKEKKIKKYMNFFEVEDKRDRYMDRCSTGELMRFKLARALLNSPKVLLLDEPTIGLDPKISLKVRNFLKKLNKKEKITMLLTTHYMEEADYLCDRIALIDKGKIIKIDTPKNLKDLLKDEIILEFRIKQITEKIIEKIDSLEYVENAHWVPEEEELRVIVESLNRSDDVIKHLRKNKIKIISMNTDEPTLEDVFIHLTKGELK